MAYTFRSLNGKLLPSDTDKAAYCDDKSPDASKIASGDLLSISEGYGF